MSWRRSSCSEERASEAELARNWSAPRDVQHLTPALSPCEVEREKIRAALSVSFSDGAIQIMSQASQCVGAAWQSGLVRASMVRGGLAAVAAQFTPAWCERHTSHRNHLPCRSALPRSSRHPTHLCPGQKSTAADAAFTHSSHPSRCSAGVTHLPIKKETSHAHHYLFRHPRRLQWHQPR